MRLFIANRGEIALRILRTAMRVGHTVLVPYVPSESGGSVRLAADESFLIPPGGFLDSELLISLAKKAGADAIHPGYGFLSESADFSQAVEDHGIIFIGPTASAMRAVGEKSKCRELAKSLGIPVAEGYDGVAQDDDTLLREGQRIGFPLLVKAASGGGGRGMRLVSKASDLLEALNSARREAVTGFGDGKLLLEKFFVSARHVEVQIIGDGSGKCEHLWDRDCTVQRRYQKLIEEAPAFGIPDKLRKRLTDAAVKLGKSVNLRSVSTVEFLVQPTTEEFIFLEVNTRLQVEHPVTEEILGLDLVELQLRIAQGEKLDALLSKKKPSRHAIEARIVSENPYEHFLPSVGKVLRLKIPEKIRVESALEEGDLISGEFDSLIAKFIAAGSDRLAAINELIEALKAFECVGPETNVPFLLAVLSDSEFQSGSITGEVVSRAIRAIGDRSHPINLARKAVLQLIADRYRRGLGFRVLRTSLKRQENYRVELRGEIVEVEIVLTDVTPEGADCVLDGVPQRISWSDVPPLERIQDSFLIEGNVVSIERLYPRASTEENVSSSAQVEVVAPLAGKVIRIFASRSAQVQDGASVVVIESMKMEHHVKAPFTGVVTEIFVAEGAVISAKDRLFILRREAG